MNDPSLRVLLRRARRKPVFTLTLARVLLGNAATSAAARATHLFGGASFLSARGNRKRLGILRRALAIRDIPLTSEFVQALPAIPLELRECGVSRDPFSIALASHETPLSDDLFERVFADPEDRMAVHRFVWLLVLLDRCPSAESVDRCLRQIAAWCLKYPKPVEGVPFDAYSISERLVAWVHFFMLVKNHISVDPLVAEHVSGSIKQQLLALARRLEFHGRLTNNHILNNARALYICGALLNLPTVQDLGKQILLAETDTFIVEGELREDSSHYQMLLTKSYLEIYHAAGFAKDDELLDWLKPRLSAMLAVCALLQSRFDAPEFPLFGDISPDVCPGWFIGRPFSPSAVRQSPWHRLLKVECAGLLSKIDASLPVSTKGKKLSRTWSVVRGNDMEAWVITKSGIECHGHNDTGNVVAFFRGEPFLVDLGLFTYRPNDPVARMQRSWEGHNTPLLDGSPPDIDRQSFLRSKLLSSRVTLLPAGDRSIAFTVGYLGGSTVLSRQVMIDGNELLITDAASSEGMPCPYESHWHIAASLSRLLQDGTTAQATFDNGLILTVEGLGDDRRITVLDAARADRYGSTKRATAILITTSSTADRSHRLRFSFGAPQ